MAFPKSSRPLIQKKLGEAVVQSYNDEENGCLLEKNVDQLSAKIKWADTIALGSGIGRDKKTQAAVNQVLKKRSFKKCVIDADAIFAINKNRYKKLNLKNLVLTPHQAEFADLIGVRVAELQKDIMKYGSSFVRRTEAYLVLKGAPTIIFTPDGDSLINSTGNPALAKFGTGDVLTGMIAGLMAQQSGIEEAIIAAVYIHGLAADLMVTKTTEYSLLASDLINYIPDAINFLRNSVV